MYLVAGTGGAPRIPCGPEEEALGFASNPWWLEEKPGVEPEGTPRSLQEIEARLGLRGLWAGCGMSLPPVAGTW